MLSICERMYCSGEKKTSSGKERAGPMELFHSMRNIMGASTMCRIPDPFGETLPLHTALQDAPDESAAGQDHLLLVELRNSGKFCASLNISLVMPDALVAPMRSHHTW